MKILSTIVVSLLFVTSVAYCDVISVLQAKKENTLPDRHMLIKKPF